MKINFLLCMIFLTLSSCYARIHSFEFGTIGAPNGKRIVKSTNKNSIFESEEEGYSASNVLDVDTKTSSGDYVLDEGNKCFTYGPKYQGNKSGNLIRKNADGSLLHCEEN